MRTIADPISALLPAAPFPRRPDVRWNWLNAIGMQLSDISANALDQATGFRGYVVDCKM